MKFILALILSIFSVNVLSNDTGAWYDPEQDGHGISLYEFTSNSGEAVRVFWWFAHEEDDSQVWLMSSVESGNDFLLYLPLAKNPTFPTGLEVPAGEPVGTATLHNVENSEDKVFTWDILVEDVTCEDLYGPTPPGPLDPRCKNEDGRFSGSEVIQEGLDSTGSSNFIRLTP
jgi:hypothetical protein